MEGQLVFLFPRFPNTIEPADGTLHVEIFCVRGLHKHHLHTVVDTGTKQLVKPIDLNKLLENPGLSVIQLYGMAGFKCSETSWFLAITGSTSQQQMHSASLSIIWQCSQRHLTMANFDQNRGLKTRNSQKLSRQYRNVNYQSKFPKRNNRPFLISRHARFGFGPSDPELESRLGSN